VNALPKLEDVRSALVDVRCAARILKYAGRIHPGSRWSAARVLDERATTAPNDVAILYLKERYTFLEFSQRANRYANFFAERGIRRNDVVAILMSNQPDYLFAVLGLNIIGAVASLLNTNVTGVQLAHAVEACAPKAVLVDGEHAKQLAEVHSSLDPSLKVWIRSDSDVPTVDKRATHIDTELDAQPSTRPSRAVVPRSNDVMCYIYTSGTTGLPKPAIVTNRRWLVAAYVFGRAIMDARAGDVIYTALPLYHSSGMWVGLGASLASGAALAIRKKFSASSFWSDVREFNASIFVYIGELCRYLLNMPPDPNERKHRLRLGVGNGLRPDVWEAFQERFAVPLIREFYGATEGNAPIINFAGRPGMLGRLGINQELVACDPATGELRRDANGFCERVKPGEQGLLLARITTLFSFEGYVDSVAKKKKVLEGVFKRGDSYFNSGDVLKLHDGGWVSFVDRVGDTFRWKGENVSTNEVAEILNGARGVLESNVYGVVVPGAEGRAGMAALSVNGDFDLNAFGGFVYNRLAAYQRPHFLRLLHDMRVTGTLKHRKVDYRDEGFDPARVSDPLYFLDGKSYVAIDASVYERIAKGELAPGR
jgi:acyl-CoA synthetase (AMP-forming)/AMP-acid ligase II